MEFSPRLYHLFVRPKWFTKKYIHNHITSEFPLDGKTVLDFGAGTGANCKMFKPSRYLGIDPDSKRVQYARKLYPDYSFQVFENDRIPAEDETIDYVVIIAVLHHISSENIVSYLSEFKRILKPKGKIIAMEPCFCDKKPLCNRFMKWYDNGQFIRNDEGYLRLFTDNQFQCRVLKKFTKCFLYHEMFFAAHP